MSSPIVRRFAPMPSSSARSQEEIIQAYEAEEERIIHVLSRKLEKLREDKINLENALEQESESHVNRLTRQLNALRQQQQQQQPLSPPPIDPPPSAMLDALRRENESLRTRLVTAERDYIRVSRLNDIFREELIELRTRLRLPVDSLIGLAPAAGVDQPLHRRPIPPSTTAATATTVASSAMPVASKPTAVQHPNGSHLSVSALPIPRGSTHLPHARPSAHWSSTTTPLSGTSPTSSPSLPTSPAAPFAFSPPAAATTVALAASGGRALRPRARSSPSPPSTASSSASPTTSILHPSASYQTSLTTPGSTSPSLNPNPPPPFPLPPPHPLSYPHVPPPSLSSSLGSPVATFHHHSAVGGGGSAASSRRSSISGYRVAETGSLIRRRSGSITNPAPPPSTREDNPPSAVVEEEELEVVGALDMPTNTST